MKSFETAKRLNVFRRLNDGSQILVGQLAQNTRAVYFQYDAGYIAKHHNLSPFNLPFNGELIQAPDYPHTGIHSVFADSLPDGWGLLLMDRMFRQHNILPQQLTSMDRLAYIADRGMGALCYAPASEFGESNPDNLTDIASLGYQATQLFDGEIEEVLTALANAGGSGGARPKALIYFDRKNPERVAIAAQPGLQPWLIKFTSRNLMLGHEEGLCEAAYLTLAKNAGIRVPDWQLFNTPAPSKAKAWLVMKRFDCSANQSTFGRYHMHTLCGLLDADFRQPSMDYEDLIKASQVLCKSPAVGKIQFARALFNLFAVNQDDHTKNWSFLMDDQGQWQPAPFYDVTFSPNPHNQHSMAFMGYANQPPVKAVQKLAKQANFTHWKEARDEIIRINNAISQWPDIARDLGVSQLNRKLITDQLNSVYQQNKDLLSS